MLAGVNYTHIFNEHWLNELRAGWDRLVQPRTGEDVSNGFPLIPGAFNDPGNILPNTFGGTPNVAVSGYSSLHPYTNLPQRRWDNHYNLVDNGAVDTWSAQLPVRCEHTAGSLQRLLHCV